MKAFLSKVTALVCMISIESNCYGSSSENFMYLPCQNLSLKVVLSKSLVGLVELRRLATRNKKVKKQDRVYKK